MTAVGLGLLLAGVAGEKVEHLGELGGTSSAPPAESGPADPAHPLVGVRSR